MNKDRYIKTALALCAVFTSTAFAQVFWDGGGADDNITTAGNWTSDTLPTGGTLGIIDESIVAPLPTIILGDLTGYTIQQDAGSVDRTVVLATWNGTSYTINAGTLDGGPQIHTLNDSSLIVNGGTVAFERDLRSAGDSTLTVTGGSLTIPGTRNILGGGGSGWGIDISGGIVDAGGFQLQTSTQQATITGGTTMIGSNGSSLSNGAGLTFGLGNGTFSYGAAPTLSTGGFINFLTGSGGSLTVTGFNQSNFETWWNDASLQRDGGNSGSLGDNFVVSGSTISVIPEPGTLVLFALGGLAVLASGRRKWRSKTA